MTNTLPESIMETAELSDLEQIMAIEDRSFPFPWTQGMIMMELFDNPFAISFVAREALNHRITGYVFMRAVVDELHLLNIAVHPKWRGKGLGDVLLQRVLQVGREREMEKVLLEVRPSNHPARALYRKYHFHLVGQRKKYYLNPTEDAILLQYDFHPGRPMGAEKKVGGRMSELLSTLHST